MQTKAARADADGTASASGVAALVRQIRTQQDKMDAGEVNAINSLVRIGALLIELKRQAKRTWTAQLKDLGYSPRVARRLQTLGDSPLAKNGLSKSALLQRLPADLLKLEWLCRLPSDQLTQVTARLDCNKEARKRVIDAVKAALGITPRPRPRRTLAGLLRAVESLVGRLRAAAADWGDDEEGRDSRRRLSDALAGSLAELQAWALPRCPRPRHRSPLLRKRPDGAAGPREQTADAWRLVRTSPRRRPPWAPELPGSE